MNITGKYLFSKPRFLEKPYGWVQHIPFAFYLMETLRPEIVTELGTHTGNSYFSFCQAADELKLNTKCYAVDTWEGDEHSGFYGKEVYDRVKKINTQHFFHLSYLLKMTFDDALSYFTDGSIDLLHIDGLHTYEAVKHDFESWLPKISNKGVVILHDTNVRERGFGVWKLFEEIRGQYPSFEFTHSHGLGILCIGKEVDKAFLDFVEKAEKDTYINHYFATLGQRVFVMQERQDIQQELQQIKKSMRQTSKEVESFREKTGDLQQSLKNKQDEVKSLSVRINEFIKRDEGNKKTIQQLQKELESLESLSTQYKTELHSKNLKIADFERSSLELKLKLEMEVEKKTIFENKVKDYQQEEEGQHELIEQLNREITRNRQELMSVRQSLAEHQEDLLSRKFEVKELRQALLSAQEQVNTLDETNKDLLSRHVNQEASTLALREAQDELRLLLREREEHIAGLTEQYGKLSSFLADVEKESEVYKRKIKQQKEVLEELQKMLEERDQELSDVKKQADSYKQQAAKYRETAEYRKQKIESGNEKIGLLREHLASVKDRIERRDKKYVRVLDDLQKVKATNQQLKKQLRAKESVLQAIVGSTSWRITRPVRYLGSLKRKISVKTLFLLRILFYILTFRFKQVRREFRYARYRKVISRSGMFDREWYLETYPDVREAGADSVSHYVRRGAAEGRDPSPDFSTQAYLNHYEDVAQSGINPFAHYILFGKGEGRIVYQNNKLKDAANKTHVLKHDEHLEEHSKKPVKIKKWPYRVSEQELLDRVKSYNAQKELRKAKVVVYTAIIGNYDALILPEAIVNEWDYVVYTDNEIKGEHIFEIRTPPFYHRDQTRMARYIKTHPHQLFPDYQCAVWIDSNILVRGGHLIKQVNRCINDDVPLLINPHPDRKSLAEELKKCIKLRKDDPALMEEQVKRYRAEGYPDIFGLFETNILIRNLRDKRVHELNKAWWQEIERGSRRDQLSLPYVLWKHNLKAEPLPGMKNIRIHAGNDYCLFNHKGQKRNKNVAFYEPPSFLETVFLGGIHRNNTGELTPTANFEKDSHLEHQQKHDRIIRDLRRKLLEAGFEEKASRDLREIVENGQRQYIKNLAAWELAVWHAGKDFEKGYDLALHYLRKVDQSLLDPVKKTCFCIMEAECYIGLNQPEKAKIACENGLKYSQSPDLFLALANKETEIDQKLQWVNEIYEHSDLMRIGYQKDNKSADYDGLITIHKKDSQAHRASKSNPMVSVIVPAFNASKTIATTLNALILQTYDHLEILVVDDSSTDETIQIVRSFMQNDDRIKLLQTPKNQGPYMARNLALKTANGKFITCNDADDWSHAQKIEYQVKALMDNPKLAANVSQWARLTEDFRFFRRNNPGFYIQLNISSLMFRREMVLDKLGCWDSVRFGADTEFYKRLLRVFGRDLVEELPPVPLSFARYSEQSLTGDPLIGYPGYPMGARREYRDSYQHYFNQKGTLKYKPSQFPRPFPIPKVMDPEVTSEMLKNRHFDLVLVSDFRIRNENVYTILDKIKKKTPESPKNVGLVHMEVYDLITTGKFDPLVREAIDGKSIQMLVFGDQASCDHLIVLVPEVLLHRQLFVPSVQANRLSVIADDILTGTSPGEMKAKTDSCRKNLKACFGQEGKWYLSDMEHISKRSDLTNTDIPHYFEKQLCPVPVNGMRWQPVSYKQHPDILSQVSKEKVDRKLPHKGIVLLDFHEINRYVYQNPDGIAVIMPCIDTQMGMDTARFLLKRAGMECLIIVVNDKDRRGFMHVFNNTVARLDIKYVVYLAQDAYPGIDWLKIAYETLEKTGKGLLAFNDGKWRGRVASFGLVRIDWVRKLYGGPVFFPGYKAHKADNELTVIARVQNQFDYNPDATLVEIDKEKIFKENIPEDKALFQDRFRNGFDGLLPVDQLKPLAKTYFVPWKDQEPVSLQKEIVKKPVVEESNGAPCSKYQVSIKPETINKLRKEYRSKHLDREKDTFALYRIIGNDLFPRHRKGQSYDNLKFILEHEPDFAQCEKIFIVNRLIDKKEEEKIIALLERHGKAFLHIPFIAEDYMQSGFDTDTFPYPGFLAGEIFQAYDDVVKGRAFSAVLRFKNNYIMNNNGARNAALNDGKKIAKWILPWDGNCYLTIHAWSDMYKAIVEKPYFKYYIVPMARIPDNNMLLGNMAVPDPVEEPQIIFRKDTDEVFNENLYYGRRPKVELLWRLGVPGKWDHYPSDDPWDPQRRALSPDAGLFGCTSWVARLSSGQIEMEKNTRESTRKRVLARVEGIVKTIERADLLISKADPEKLTSFRLEVLNKQKQHYLGKKDPDLHNLVKLLMAEARTALGRGPYSVTDKSSLPPSNDPHDYWHPAPYWWPNEKTKTGLPYVRKDGVRVPGTRMYEPESEKYDRTRIQRVFDDSVILALACFFSDDDGFALHAVKSVERFFVNPETKMNPNLLYGQVRMGHNQNHGSSSGIIETKDMYYFLDAVRLLKMSGLLPPDTLEKFKQWLENFLDWLLESEQGKTECTAKNNHGTCYDLQIASIASFLGEFSILFQTLARAQSRIPQQFHPDGTQIHEMKRTMTAHYCAFNFQSWLNLAEVASRFNVDLWNYTSPDGAGLNNAAKWMIKHMQKKWPYKQIEPFDRERFMPIIFAVKEKMNINLTKLLPAHPYHIKPLFFPHDGIRPFWNIDKLTV